MARSSGLNPLAALFMLACVCALMLLCMGAPAASPAAAVSGERYSSGVEVIADVFSQLAAYNRAAMQTNAHAVEGHGEKAATVAQSFTADGICSDGVGSARLKEPASGRFILCAFLDAAGSLMRMHVMEEDGTTVTDIPEEHIPKPERYLTNAATKRGYTLEQAFGDIPEWVNRLFQGKLSTP